MTLRKINGLTRGLAHDIKVFALGVLLTLLALALVWVSKNYKSLVVAITYPEVVAQMNISRELKVK